MALRSGRVGIHPSQVDPITGMLLGGPTPGSVSFEDLSDAQITDPEAGQTLQYNGTGWHNVFASISPTTLATLRDVEITDPEDGEYLTYDSTNEKWVNSREAPAPTYTDLTVIMYGAVEDTISFTDAAGVSHNEVFASGQSSKSVTFKINPSGSTSITLTSAVAKNPDDLTADFSKSVTITDATTEIKVMPDNALYWWGYQSSNMGNSESEGWSDSSATSSYIIANTNHMAFDYGAGGAIGGLVSKTPIPSVSAIKAVGNFDNLYIFSNTVKTLGSSSSQKFTQTGNSLYTKTVSLTNAYIGVGKTVSGYGVAGTLSALWYE